MAYTDIDKPSDYFNTKIFTGDNSANNSVTAVGFQPNWIWFKNRNAANDHALVDSVRGRKALSTNNNSAELTLNADKDFQSFDSDGFTVDVVEQLNSFNKSGDSLVSWNWKAGTSVSGNTGGSGTAKSYSGSVNTDAGFSITSFTGNGTIGHTIPHSLNAIPSMFIIKKYGGSGDSTARDWDVYHQSLGNTKVIFLNTTAAHSTSSEYWNDTTPTSSVITLGANDQINGNNNTYICYAFSEKKGYSKFGSYIGGGSNFPFIYTGFKPAFVLIKNTNATQSWRLVDNKRIGYNPNNIQLYPNLTNAESTSEYVVDIISNGFKVIATDAGVNGSGNTLIYMAFSSEPFTTSSGVPATAR